MATRMRHIAPSFHRLYRRGKMLNAILSIAMLVAFLLVYGAIKLGLRDGFDKKPLLMIVAAVVIAANIVIWAVPDDKGRSLLQEAERGDGKSALE